MKFIRVYCILFTLIGIINFGDAFNITDINSTSDICTKDKCIMKCCGIGKFINQIIFIGKDGHRKRKTKCENYNLTETHSFEKELDDLFITKPNTSAFEIKAGIFTTNKTFRLGTKEVSEHGYNLYLNKKSEVMLEIPNAYDRWIHVPNNMYCIDSILVTNKTSGEQTFKPGVWTFFVNVPDEKNHPTTTILTVGLLVSCVFLALVLVVYGVLPELRNLCGLILMAYVASLLGAFLMLVVMRVKIHEGNVCEGLTYVIYFFFMASFCWMNVMSFDIWWTFRGYAKSRPIHRRGERFKFLMYSLYAFGVPLAMTVNLGALNKANLRHMPWFVTPKIPSSSCFIKEGEKLLYLYVPMLILILCNWLLYTLTAVNIWKLSRGTAMLDSGAAGSSQARRLNRRRFFIYLKLSIVMGLNWLLEVASYTFSNSFVWYVSDCYNMLIGVAIFIIFVCKPKIFIKLRQRLSGNSKSKWYPGQEETSRSGTTGEISCTQDMLSKDVPLDTFTTRK